MDESLVLPSPSSPSGPLMRRTRQTPAEAVAEGQEWATVLMDVVRKGKISVSIRGREYLKVEAWQTLARFNRCWIDTEWTKDVKDADGKTIGVEARARLVSIDTGQRFGGAEGACMMDEEFEKDDGTVVERWTDYYAVRSMAQTRAQGKVGRMAYAWVAVLAGYEATPAEEMTAGILREQTVCPKCGKAAIIKGKAEFGGGWLCFKKKGGCGAKFTEEPQEWAGRAETSGNPLTMVESVSQAARDTTTGHAVKPPAPTIINPEVSSPEMRTVLLGRIQAVMDKKAVPPLDRAALWQEWCGKASEQSVDVSALQDLYAAVLKR